MNRQHFDLVVLGGGIVGLWTARMAARAGAQVAVVEVGPLALGAQREATPPIRFAEHANAGALRARNHVLTGNSSYWGGGLARNSREALVDLYGASTAAAVEREYPEVERTLGVADGFEPAPLSLGGRPLQEVAVLPGKLRGLWSDFHEPGVTCLTGAHVVDVCFHPGGGIATLTVKSSSGATQLSAPEFSLSMGVIDSILFAQGQLAPAVPVALRPLLGTRLHDHWSVPIASVTWHASASVDALFPPKFRAGVIAGRRLRLERGFFHVVADLDGTPPYDRVKAFMRARQQGVGPLSLARAAFGTLASPVRMARAGIHYLAHHELHIRDGTEVRLVLDFESSRAPENHLVMRTGEATLHWDMRDGDRAYFEQVLRHHRDWWQDVWHEAGIQARWLFDEWSGEALSHHLAEHAVDAYHLGGGLHPDTPTTEGVSELDGRLRGCQNVFVNGTAFFCRPGQANPVLTLLARASIYVRTLAKGGGS